MLYCIYTVYRQTLLLHTTQDAEHRDSFSQVTEHLTVCNLLKNKTKKVQNPKLTNFMRWRFSVSWVNLVSVKFNLLSQAYWVVCMFLVTAPVIEFEKP